MSHFILLMKSTAVIVTLLGVGIAKGECVPSFSCDTVNKKEIKVCNSGNYATYSFGSIGEKPEILLTIDKSKLDLFRDPGQTRYRLYSVGFPNGPVTYSVFFSLDALVPDEPTLAGVEVRINNKTVRTISCAPEVRVRDGDLSDFFPP